MEYFRNVAYQSIERKCLTDIFCGSNCCKTNIRSQELETPKLSTPTAYRRADEEPILTSYRRTSNESERASNRKADEERIKTSFKIGSEEKFSWKLNGQTVDIDKLQQQSSLQDARLREIDLREGSEFVHEVVRPVFVSETHKPVQITLDDCEECEETDAKSGNEFEKPDVRPTMESLPASLQSTSPKDPISCCAVCLVFMSIVLPSAISVLGFSTMAWGLNVYSTLAHDQYSSYGFYALGAAFAVAIVLLICDWVRYPKFFKLITGAIPLILFCAAAVLSSRDYPWAPMLLVLFFMPALLGALRLTFCRTVKRRTFYRTVALMTLLAGTALAGAWIYYIVAPPQNHWNDDTKEKLAEEASDIYRRIYKRPLIYSSDCGPHKNDTVLNALSKDEKVDIKNACANAGTLCWLSWMEPIVAAICNIVICVFCLMTGAVGKVDNISEVQGTLTRFFLMLTFLLAGLYSCAVLSATSLRYGSTLMAFYLAGVCVVCIWIFLELDLKLLLSTIMRTKIMQQLVALSQSDWTKALAVGALGGPVIIFIVSSSLTNRLRKCRTSNGAAKNDRFTPLARKVLTTVENWNWTGIVVKIILLGELFFTLQVGVAKATYVFLSWLNVFFADTNFLMLCIIVCGIGFSMFLLPPVPGLPVYVFAGILIGEKGRQNESIGFWLGCSIATGLSLITKCIACVGQYMIGYFLGKSVKVQQLIGVDKVPTRAIEMVLKSRGLGLGKVSILVGGPDWPTSVTCGIIHVNIPQMLLGTLPVVTLLAPCVLAGASLGRLSPGEDSFWRTLAHGSTAAAALINMSASAYAVYTISQVVQQHGEELAKPRKEHEAVAALTKKEQAYVDAYNRMVEWGNICIFWKILLITCVVCMLGSNVAFVFLAELCFRPFALSSKINDSYDDDGLNGDALNIILFPTGWAALAVFAFAVMLHLVWTLAMRCKATRLASFVK